MDIIWSKLAVSQLADAIEFITENGYLTYAAKVEADIFAESLETFCITSFLSS